MLIRLGYDIELEISKPMTVVAVLNVHPSRAGDLLEPDEIQISPPVPREAIPRQFRKHLHQNRGAAGPSAPFEFHSDRRFRQARRRGLECRTESGRAVCRTKLCNFCSPAAIAKSTGFPIWRGNCSRTMPRDGQQCRRSAIGSINMSHSTTTLPGPPRQRSMSTASARECAGTSSIWRSRFAAPCTFLRDMRPGTWETSASRCAARWTSAHGSRSTWRQVVDVRCPQQSAANRPGAHGDGTRCRGCGHYNLVRSIVAEPVLRRHR